MSRGLGAVQRLVLAELRGAGGLLRWDALKEGYPLLVEDHSLHRAVRSLKKRGRIREVTVGGKRWLAFCAPASGWSKSDRQLLELGQQVHYGLRVIARARGVPVPPESDALGASLDAYRRQIVRGD